jgi:hypothetical protein
MLRQIVVFLLLSASILRAYKLVKPSGLLQTLKNQASRSSATASITEISGLDPPKAKTAIIIVDHGSRKREANDMLIEVGRTRLSFLFLSFPPIFLYL